MGKIATAVIFHIKIYDFLQLSERMWRTVKRCADKYESCLLELFFPQAELTKSALFAANKISG